MTARLHHIAITNFKAFRHFELPLEGRHLLVYGANGSGKSSLYWALYTFLQSARKPMGGIAKYFDAADPENLLNIHEQQVEAPRPGEIALTLRDTATHTDTTYRISKEDHGTCEEPLIRKADMASDFITYRFFFGFAHFRNSQQFNLWPLFEKEILPFCVSTGTGDPLKMWQRIRGGDPNPAGSRGLGGTAAYESFRQRVDAFATVLAGIVDSISTEAQEFYDEHFAREDPAKIRLKLAVTRPPSATGSNQTEFKFKKPRIGFAIEVAGQPIKRPQSFLNEAKLTQLALSVRFGASLVNLHDSELKLLVLDDLLVSLDMSNRMQVVQILLSDTFTDFQKIILTHDLGLFRECRRDIGDDHTQWQFMHLQGDAAHEIVAQRQKTPLQKAQDYLERHDLEEAAMCLRKAAEHTASYYLKCADSEEIPLGKFRSLTENLHTARKRLLAKVPTKLYRRVLRNTPEAHRALLVAPDDSDIDNNPDLTPEEKGILKCNRKRLSQVLSSDGWAVMEKIEAIDGVLSMTERVLNPASHGGDAPLYEAEVRRAERLVNRFRQVLSP